MATKPVSYSIWDEDHIFAVDEADRLDINGIDLSSEDEQEPEKKEKKKVIRERGIFLAQSLAKKDRIIEQKEKELEAKTLELKQKAIDAKLAAEIGQRLLEEKEALAEKLRLVSEQMEAGTPSPKTRFSFSLFGSSKGNNKENSPPQHVTCTQAESLIREFLREELGKETVNSIESDLQTLRRKLKQERARNKGQLINLEERINSLRQERDKAVETIASLKENNMKQFVDLELRKVNLLKGKEEFKTESRFTQLPSATVSLAPPTPLRSKLSSPPLSPLPTRLDFSPDSTILSPTTNSSSSSSPLPLSSPPTPNPSIPQFETPEVVLASKNDELFLKWETKLATGILDSPTWKWKSDSELSDLVCAGIPSSLRSSVWLKMALAEAKESTDPEGYYQDLVKRSHDVKAPAASDIIKDLHRTLPNKHYFSTGKGRESLRRVLKAFALHNVDIGYCQGLNILAASILLVVKSEYAAFWILVRLVEPRASCYAKNLCGLVVDLRVLQDLISFTEPDTHRLLSKQGLCLKDICSPWLMCLFMHSPLPFEYCLRFWDAYLFYGEESIFFMAVAILQSKRDALMESQSAEETISLLLHKIHTQYESTPSDVNQLMILFQEVYSADLMRKAISSLREFHRADVLTENVNLSSTTVKLLQSRYSIPSANMQQYWQSFLQQSWNTLVSGCITSRVDFVRAITDVAFDERQRRQIVGHGLISGIFGRLFDMLAIHQKGQIAFEEFLDGVNLFIKSSRAERLRGAFRFCDRSRQFKVRRDDLMDVLMGFEQLYYGMRKHSLEAQTFCDMAFEKYSKDKDYLLWEEFAKVALLHPLLVSFFRLDVASDA